MADDDFKRQIFQLALARLKDRSDSLVRFLKHWQGSSSGIEGWFKLEFTAAIEPFVATIHAGGAGGHGKLGTTCADLILETPSKSKIPLEMKGAGNSWYIGGANIAERYRGHVLAFMCRSTNPINPAHQLQLTNLDPHSQISLVCEVEGAKKACAIYFGMVDLRYL